jgi:hypothetical protein
MFRYKLRTLLIPDELVAQRLPYVQKTRASYQEFWEQNVRPA